MRSKIAPLIGLDDWPGVLAHGCFDCLHVGHIRYLEWAKSLCPDEPLIVTITADKFFPTHKGKNRPAFPQDIRAEWLSALECVGIVAIVGEPTGVMAIDIIKPRIYAKGDEAEGLIAEESAALLRHGGVVRFMSQDFPGRQTWSSSKILCGEYLRSHG